MIDPTKRISAGFHRQCELTKLTGIWRGFESWGSSLMGENAEAARRWQGTSGTSMELDGASPHFKSLADAAAFDLDAVIRNEIPLRKQEKIITSKAVRPDHETERNMCGEVSQLP